MRSHYDPVIQHLIEQRVPEQYRARFERWVLLPLQQRCDIGGVFFECWHVVSRARELESSGDLEVPADLQEVRGTAAVFLRLAWLDMTPPAHRAIAALLSFEFAFDVFREEYTTHPDSHEFVSFLKETKQWTATHTSTVPMVLVACTKALRERLLESKDRGNGMVVEDHLQSTVPEHLRAGFQRWILTPLAERCRVGPIMFEPYSVVALARAMVNAGEISIPGLIREELQTDSEPDERSHLASVLVVFDVAVEILRSRFKRKPISRDWDRFFEQFGAWLLSEGVENVPMVAVAYFTVIRDDAKRSGCTAATLLVLTVAGGIAFWSVCC
ncbi:MAG: hypothetical protein KDB80_03650 [Planctomycetes bacterium]|nr:hypothetical protein [Planctomycetota bacterium]